MEDNSIVGETVVEKVLFGRFLNSKNEELKKHIKKETKEQE